MGKLYKDDLSKFIFNMTRRSCPVIANYPINFDYFAAHHNRSLRSPDRHQNMEEFIQPFMNVLIENNYNSPQRGSDDDTTMDMFYYLEFGDMATARANKYSKYSLRLCCE